MKIFVSKEDIGFMIKKYILEKSPELESKNFNFYYDIKHHEATYDADCYYEFICGYTYQEVYEVAGRNFIGEENIKIKVSEIFDILLEIFKKDGYIIDTEFYYYHEDGFSFDIKKESEKNFIRRK